MNQNLVKSEKDVSGNDLDIKSILEKYLRHWKWFALSIFICLLLAFLKLNFSRKQYEASATIKIKDEKAGDKNALSSFKDLGFMNNTKENIEDEIEIFKSKNLISKTVKSLNLNISFFTQKNYLSSLLDDNLGFNSNFYEIDNYKNNPLKINFNASDSIVDKLSTRFLIVPSSETRYTYTDLETSQKKTADFGKKLRTEFGEITVLPNTNLKKLGLIGKDILVSVNSIKNLTNAYQKSLLVEPKSDFSNILTLTIQDGNTRRGEDFLNELINQYNKRAIKLKIELSKNTSDFVSERLGIISKELSNVDLTAENIKTQFRMSDAASDAGLNMQADQEIENQIVAVRTDLSKINYLKEVLNENQGKEVININVGNGSVSDLTSQYNKLVMQRERLLKNSTDKNPIIVNLDDQLKTLSNNIKQGLNNIESSQKIALEGLNRRGSLIKSRLYSAPKKERKVRDVQREQQIKEQLYLYLLQKREETAITLGVADPNAKIIDMAETVLPAVGPKKKLMFILAGIIGLLIPIAIIYFLDLLDSKIHTREDVEKVLNIPIIGDIPKLEKSQERYLIKKEDYSSIAEAFRILRTNINFILPNKGMNKSKVIFVTSTIAHEGKSLVSSNLATSLAHAGKKTLLMGMDIRAPKIVSYLGDRGKVGITNYIVDSNISAEDITVNSNVENLTIMSSGDLAPNPAELLMDSRVSDLFDYAKENYEYVIVDTAAFSMVTDTLILSKYADAFIYVIRTNFLDKRMLKYVDNLHKDQRIPNLALLINGVDHKKSYGYGYGYGYGSQFEESKKKKKFL